MLVERLSISDFGLVLRDYEVSLIGVVCTGARAIKARFQIYLKRVSGKPAKRVWTHVTHEVPIISDFRAVSNKIEMLFISLTNN